MRRQSESWKAEKEAAGWLGRLDGGVSPGDAADFKRWRDSDPGHAEAFENLAQSWKWLDWPRTEGLSSVVRAELRERRQRRRARRMAWAGAAALAAACLAVALRIERRPPSAAWAAATARVVGPERRVLQDGSVVEVRDGSRLEVAFGGGFRRVRLLKGEACFQVAKDKVHPFLVDAGSVETRAVGTAFSVSVAPGRVEVLVTEGCVAVRRLAPTGADAAVGGIIVAAGNRIAVPTGAADRGVPSAVPADDAEMGERLAWRVPRLEFTDTTLAEAAVLFNARNRGQLEIADPAVSQVRVNGVFREDNVAGFVRLLESGFGMKVERPASGVIVIRGKN